MHESLRCFPPSVDGAARLTLQDVDVNGTIVPTGTMLLLCIWAVHYSEEAWGSDAGQWRPGRWLEGSSVSSVKKDASGHLRWLPFTHGEQNCIGQHLAMVRSISSTWCMSASAAGICAASTLFRRVQKHAPRMRTPVLHATLDEIADR